MVFKNYAKYYNLLYSDKNYSFESQYIIDLIQKYNPGVKYFLDIGCGTGKHAALIAEKGYNVIGVDLSEEMIGIAKSKQYPNCQFYSANAKDFSFENQFDVITSLFHVVSYQTDNDTLEKVFLNIKKHLKPNGIFIFDFWYTPAVLTQKPSVKVKRLADANINVTRLSEPVHHINENLIDVNFELHIQDKITNTNEVIMELHKMRYFSIPELDFFLKKCGLQSVKYEEWLTGEEPSENTWGVCCIAKN